MSAPRTLAVFHVAEVSGPLRDLEIDLDWVVRDGSLEVVAPGPGAAADAFRSGAAVGTAPYAALTLPDGPVALAGALGRLAAEARVFRARLRDVRPEAVVVATSTVPSAVLAARMERVPVIVYAAEILAGGNRGSVVRDRAGRLLISLTGRLATAVVACSRTVASQFERRGADVTVAYPPIRDAYSDGDGDGFRAANGIPPARPLIVAVGSITRGRGQDVLLRALAAIRRRGLDAGCALVGVPFGRRKDIAFRNTLDRLAEELGVAEAVAFVPVCERIADAYAAADVVVNPVRVPESFGRASCEALVAGRPVVASRVGAVPEVLRDRETAVLVPPDNPEELAAAIRRLLDNPDEARRIADAGRRDVLDRFPPERSRATFEAVLQRVTGNPATADMGASPPRPP
jgi:glycosyltransferase involved in cell wall biosynthesis